MPNPTPDIPDRLLSYLNEIAERLTTGHAAVVVGAGFSRNANRSGTSQTEVSNVSKPMSYSDVTPRLPPPSRLDFPTWSELGHLFYSKLHPKVPVLYDRPIDVPTLAQEVENTFGRPAVDRILLDAIPDRVTEPSPLHVKLLSLPWSDVFTTNYDTLLERACQLPLSRQYNHVVTKEDFGHSAKPRIVKLHGSFPSARPFIVTEDDYQRYLDTHAIFANTLRQALVENTLCMIGFSGDDPNFLHLANWIHETLGQHAPKIYRVDVLSSQDSKEQQLNYRNIVPVDMSEAPGVNGDRVVALKYFLDYLQRAIQDNEDNPPTSSGLGQQTVNNLFDWPTAVRGPASSEDTTDPSAIIRTWKAQRLSYPGWVIVPEDRRLPLWIATSRWIRDLPAADSVPGFVDLEFAFELTWRMEKCLCPLLDTQVSFFEATLDRYLPFVDVGTPLDSLSPSPADMNARELTRDMVSDMLHELLLVMMRHYREEGLLDKWADACRHVGKAITTLSPERNERFQYERALSALFALNLPDLKSRLAEWSDNDELPFWAAKKAGLLAELGRVTDARHILEQSLDMIRAKLNLTPTSADYTLVSQESLVMHLLQAVQQSSILAASDQSDTRRQRREFRERWHVLKQYKCDPWQEIETFEHKLQNLSTTQSDVTERPTFDIGRSVQTHHMGAWNEEARVSHR